MLNTEASCREFLAAEDPTTIAFQIRRDQEFCQSQKLPSILVHYLPPVGSLSADKISLCLFPETARYGRSITRAQYAGTVQSIKSYLESMAHIPQGPKLPAVPVDDTVPSKKDIESTLSVLDFFTKRGQVNINLNTPLQEVVQILQGQLQNESIDLKGNSSLPIQRDMKVQEKKCYICQFLLISPHLQYPSLCKSCGDFNLASCDISLPNTLNLKSRTALVTGGRVNLGYHTALRLLRCGAKVMVTSRYPRDAETRFLSEIDSQDWSNSLRIIGADFRAAKDVFHLVAVVKEQLHRWNESSVKKLDILINNAAQTLTDPLEKERHAVEREQKLIAQDPNSIYVLSQSKYQVRIRGGVQSSHLLEFEKSQPGERTGGLPPFSSDTIASIAQPDDTISAYHPEPKSSWMQTLHQIPYEDVVSAHSVNTFVPLILIRELLPLMGTSKSPLTSSKSSNPLAHIINVTSREGIFEANPDSSSKRGHHVHTNITKAALNMITETEAEPAWKEKRVAINSVDPGYMSAAPEIEQRWREKGREACPIGWEDGAGRVLWPIAMGEKGQPVWGRLLKHFGAVEVNVGAGR